MPNQQHAQRQRLYRPSSTPELTIVVGSDVRPWRYPQRCEFQYNEWLRHEFESVATRSYAALAMDYHGDQRFADAAAMLARPAAALFA